MEHTPAGLIESGLLLADNAAVDCHVDLLQASAWSPGSTPHSIEAILAHPSGMMRVRAFPRSFMALSRPGPAGSRVYTSLGFARFEMDDAAGAGMFECSTSIGAPATVAPEPADVED